MRLSDLDRAVAERHVGCNRFAHTALEGGCGLGSGSRLFRLVSETSSTHYAFPFGGISGDVPVVGDWNGNGITKVGVFRLGFFWVLDANGNHQFDGATGGDLAFAFGGVLGDKPVVGKW